jgi:hypothetical protein
MVRIDKVSPTLLSTDPELTFDLALRGMDNDSFLLDFTGEAFCSDGAKIGNLNWLVSMSHRPHRLIPLWDHHRTFVEFPIQATLRLSCASIQRLERLRDSNPLRDVVIDCSMRARILSSTAKAFPAAKFAGSKQAGLAAPVFLTIPGDGEYSGVTLVSTSDRGLAEIDMKEGKAQIKISASDWAQEFSKVFGLGRRILIEVPVLDSHELSECDQLPEVLLRCLAIIPRLNEKIARCDWSGALPEARAFLETAKGDDFVEALVSGGLPADTVECVRKAIEFLFGFCSTLVHTRDRDGQLREVVDASREDVEMLQAFIASLMNLTLKRLTRTRPD